MSPGIGLTDGTDRPLDSATWTSRDLVTILDHVPGMVALWDGGLRNRFANRAYVEWFGITPAQMRGMHIAELLGPIVFESNRPFIEGALSGERQLFERTLIDVLGRRRVTQAEYVPRTVNGRPDGFFVLVTDISARVDVERSLRESVERVAVLGERQRIAADLHRQVLQGLLDVSLTLAAVVSASPPEVAQRVNDAIDGIDGTISDLRASVYSLRRAVTSDDAATGVSRVVDEAGTVLGFTPNLTVSGALGQVPPAIANEMLAVLNEALANVAKHAHAQHVDVTITVGQHRVDLMVADDGRGIVQSNRSSGLANMAARAARLNGTFDWQANDPTGTVVHWQVPIGRPRAAPATTPNPQWSADPTPRGGHSESGDESDDRLWNMADMVAVLDNMPGVVTLWDNDLYNRFANTFAVNWFGRESREEVLGRHISELINPEVYEANLPYARAALAGVPQQFERVFVNSLGERHHTLVDYTPNIVAGVVHGMFVLVTDITARVEAQDRLSHSLEQIAVLHDRERIAEDLHDIVIQRLFAASIGLVAAQRDSSPANGARIEMAVDRIDDAILALRAAIKELRAQRSFGLGEE